MTIDPKFTQEQVRDLIENAPRWAVQTIVHNNGWAASHVGAGIPIMIKDLTEAHPTDTPITVQASQNHYPDTGAEDIWIEVDLAASYVLNQLRVQDARALAHALLEVADDVERGSGAVSKPKFADFNDALTYAIGEAVAASPAGVTNQEIEDALDLEEADVRNLLSGRESWNVDQLTTIAGLLNTDPSTLVRAAQDAQEAR